ncbi:hypothetical protein D5086_012805 [Populus alba]|uniref:Uncharacterized protein n=2 Tax=Populus TaxID=3689 RepID=A0ACC4C3X7_POPAL|nr:hypothetical protein NC653_016417 [Populus alba x Populus x berolinensis]
MNTERDSQGSENAKGSKLPYKRNRPQEGDSVSTACNISPTILDELRIAGKGYFISKTRKTAPGIQHVTAPQLHFWRNDQEHGGGGRGSSKRIT